MGTREDVAEAMAGLGPLDEDIVSVLETPEASWLVSYEDCDVALEFDDTSRVLSLATLLGAAKAERALDVYATLLKYNAIRRETGGIVMTMLPDERVVQTLDMADAHITADLCATVMRNFVTKARVWRGFIASTGSAAAPDRTADLDELLSFSIRV